MQAGLIINRLISMLPCRELPVSFLAFDCETSGFSRENDVILEYGHCLVKDRQVVDRASFLINWYDSQSVPASYLDMQLSRIDQSMRVKNRSWRITPELLKKGIAPAVFLPWLHDYLSTIKDRGLMFVSHNGVNFDTQMIEASFEKDLGRQFDFGADQVFDTGAIVKASQMTDMAVALPWPNETMHDYFSRICYCKAPGVEWNLDKFCVDRYDLVRKYGVDKTKAHSAGEDAFALHCLMEEFRELAQAASDVTNVVTSVVAPRERARAVARPFTDFRGQRCR